MSTRARDPLGYYKALGLPPGAELDAVKRAFRSAIKRCHPDTAESPPDPGQIRQLYAAHRVLSDPEQKRLYDAQGGANGPDMGAALPVPTDNAPPVAGDGMPEWLVWHLLSPSPPATGPAAGPEALRALALYLAWSAQAIPRGTLVNETA